MKVMLTAFGERLKSKIMEFPEETPPKIHLNLPFENIRLYGGDEPASGKQARGEFVFTRQYLIKGDEPVAIYALTRLEV